MYQVRVEHHTEVCSKILKNEFFFSISFRNLMKKKVYFPATQLKQRILHHVLDLIQLNRLYLMVKRVK